MTQMIKTHVKDPGSAITHFIGMLMAIFAAVPLLIKAMHEPSRIYVISIAVYAVSLILLYAASTTYPHVDRSRKVNTILKKIDHMMIFVLIAGSYTPICLLVLRNRTGILLLSIVWGIAILGIVPEGLLGILSQVGILRAFTSVWAGPVYWLLHRSSTPCHRRPWLAPGRGYHLHLSAVSSTP